MLLINLRFPALSSCTLLLLSFLAVSRLIGLGLSGPLEELFWEHMLAIFQTY
jgi:hypothetical protein